MRNKRYEKELGVIKIETKQIKLIKWNEKHLESANQNRLEEKKQLSNFLLYQEQVEEREYIIIIIIQKVIKHFSFVQK